MALLFPGRDDQAGGDVAQAQALVPVVEGDGEHRVVGHGGAADHLAAGAGRLAALRGGTGIREKGAVRLCPCWLGPVSIGTVGVARGL